MHGGRPKSWVVMTSFNNLNWKQVDEVSLSGDAGGNKTPFVLKKAVSCKHFRIILKSNVDTTNVNCFLFTFFDCFGEIGMKSLVDNSWKQRNFFNVFLSSFLNIFASVI